LSQCHNKILISVHITTRSLLTSQQSTASLVPEKRLSKYVKDTNIGREYGLSESQLEGISWEPLRTGYEGEAEHFPDEKYASKIYLRSDVVRRAMDIYKTQLNINRKKFDKPVREEDDFGDAVTNLLSMLRKEDKTLKNKKAFRTTTKPDLKNLKRRKALKKNVRSRLQVILDDWRWLDGQSQLAAPLTAMFISLSTNFVVFLLKLVAWKMTGSASMFSESIHSLVDTINQCLLAFGLISSYKKPHPDHPYGFEKKRYIYALISGVTIFYTGAAATIYHGVQQLYNPSLVLDHSIGLAYTLLLVCGMIEGYSLYKASKMAQFLAKAEGVSLYDALW